MEADVTSFVYVLFFLFSSSACPIISYHDDISYTTYHTGHTDRQSLT